jgi:2-amino-4-hydroxy-6-hydroxymethyldihydropteridine diphosphokinase
MDEILLLLGSNKGDRLSYLNSAIKRISSLSLTNITSSSVYESEPWGFDTETWFLNCAIKMTTLLAPEELIKKLLQIELDLGRVRLSGATGYESREIDIDVIFFADRIIDNSVITVPHPKMHLRKFVLIPACEIAPNYIHPVFNRDMGQLLESCLDESMVIKAFE